MSNATDTLLTQWPMMQVQFGESVTYTPSGGAATSITAIIRRNGIAREWDAPIRSLEETSGIIFDSSDVSDVVIGLDKIEDSTGRIYVLSGVTRQYGTIISGELKRLETSAIGQQTQRGY